MKEPITRHIIPIEIKHGFLNIPLVLQNSFPKYKKRLPFIVDGKKRRLAYNPTHKRIWGLISFYRKMNARPQDIITFIPRGKTTLELKFEKKISFDVQNLPTRTKGNIAEERIGELILLYGQGLLNTYKPISDIEGIDLIVFKKDSFLSLYLQIKSKYKLRKGGLLQIGVKQRGFRTHNSFYIIGTYFNPEKMDLDDRLIFIPSQKFQKYATKVRSGTPDALYVMTVPLLSNYHGRFSKFLIKKEELVEKVFKKFESMKTKMR